MPQVNRTPAAVADLDAIYDYIAIERQSPSAADRWLSRLEAKMIAYANQPEMGDLRSEIGDEIRSFTFEKQYVVIYRPLDNGIDVLRVFHGARNYPRLFRRGQR